MTIGSKFKMFRNRRVLAFLVSGAVLFFCGAGLLAFWALWSAKPAQLSWDPPTVRKSLMSFGYKVYANAQVADGKYFLSKLVLKNTGGRPIHDLTVSYQIPDYIAWTTPEVSGDLPPGNSVVELYYPKFSEKITRLANQTPATLEIKLQWREEGGSAKEQVLRDDFVIYGVNEVQYSDLPADDMLTWYDQWNLAQFVVCMVTPNDPIVKEYAAAITKRIGGTLAGATQDPQQVFELMKAIYDYMRETGMRYASAEGVPTAIGDIKTLVQTVRLPRDVITSNNGLCIELAILWASILDQLGCQAYIVLRPGHAFTVVRAADRDFPIECTAITPKAVGENTASLARRRCRWLSTICRDNNSRSSCPCSSTGARDTRRLNCLMSMLTRSKACWPPERGKGRPLPRVWPLPKVKPLKRKRGRRARRLPAKTNPSKEWRDMSTRSGLVSFSYPESWQILQPPTALGITFRVYDPSTSMGMDVVEVPNANSTNEAIKAVARAFARNGGRIQVEDSKKEGELTVVLGRTLSPSGNSQWFGVFRPVRGGVIGVAAGSPTSNFQTNRQALLQLLDTVRFP